MAVMMDTTATDSRFRLVLLLSPYKCWPDSVHPLHTICPSPPVSTVTLHPLSRSSPSSLPPRSVSHTAHEGRPPPRPLPSLLPSRTAIVIIVIIEQVELEF